MATISRRRKATPAPSASTSKASQLFQPSSRQLKGALRTIDKARQRIEMDVDVNVDDATVGEESKKRYVDLFHLPRHRGRNG